MRRGYTDSKGNFSCNGRFRRDANYSIKWGGKSLHYASIHRAAYRHFYGYNLGIKRPYKKPGGSWKICYYSKRGTGDFWGDLGGSILPDIRIFGYDSKDGAYKETDLVYRTTAHELGHASHCVSMGNIKYWQVSKIIYESWADAVEWALTHQTYNELGLVYNNDLVTRFNKQNWPYHGGEKEYSSLFIDLNDNYNQSKNNKGGKKYPNDNVTGYSMGRLSSIVAKSYGLISLKRNLKANKPYRVTDSQINELFNKYEEVW